MAAAEEEERQKRLKALKEKTDMLVAIKVGIAKKQLRGVVRRHLHRRRVDRVEIS